MLLEGSHLCYTADTTSQSVELKLDRCPPPKYVHYIFNLKFAEGGLHRPAGTRTRADQSNPPPSLVVVTTRLVEPMINIFLNILIMYGGGRGGG